MTKELDIFNDKSIASFGGRSLTKNLSRAEGAIAEMAEDFRIHNHSNSQFSWTRFVLVHKGGLRNIRQISAEIDRKKLALMEAKHRYAKKGIEIKLMRQQADNLSKRVIGLEMGLDREMIEAQIAEAEDGLSMGLAMLCIQFMNWNGGFSL